MLSSPSIQLNPVVPPAVTIEVMGSPAALSKVYVAALAVSAGCNGSDTVGYVLSASPISRSDLERRWVLADSAAASDLRRWCEANSPPSAPGFDSSWPGTLAEYRRAERQAARAKQAWDAKRRAEERRAVDGAWRAAGCTFTTLCSGYVPTCGGEYDEFATPTPGTALKIISARGCRCGCGTEMYADDARGDDLTPEMILVTFAAPWGTTALMGSCDPSQLSAAVVAAEAAYRTAAARCDDNVARCDLRLATTEKTVEQMTFAQFHEFQKETEVRFPGGWPAGIGAREKAALARRRFVAGRAEVLKRAAARAAAEEGMFVVGERLERSWI